jgi:hypothetical protein
MIFARNERLMNSDPHPLVGWARFLQWTREASTLSTGQTELLRDAVHRAEQVYKHWRPELRYKTCDVQPSQIDEVRRAAAWFIENQSRLWENK